MKIEWKKFRNTRYSVSEYGLVSNDDTDRLLSPGISSAGYKVTRLRVNNKSIMFSIHVLVAIVFLGFVPDGRNSIVHHKDGNKLNNHKDNLEIITFRKNCSIERTLKSSSIYPGVCWCKRSNKWYSRIRIKGKSKYLGYFDKEIDAANAYNAALKRLE